MQKEKIIKYLNKINDLLKNEDGYICTEVRDNKFCIYVQNTKLYNEIKLPFESINVDVFCCKHVSK